MHEAVLNAFHATARLSREAIFDDGRLTPESARVHSTMAAPGWVGTEWQPGGTVLMAINPGGGGDAYRGNPTDDELYGRIAAFRDAGQQDREPALRALSATWVRVQRTHGIRRVVDPVLAATRSTYADSAFLNVLPFRTRNDQPARSRELRRSWELATSAQLAALAPRRVIALGCKAHNALVAVGADKVFEVVLIKRSIGDSALTAQAKKTIATLKGED